MVGGRVTRDCRACGLESARSIARSPSPHASTHRCVRRPAGCRRAWRAGDLNLPLDALLSSTALTLGASACSCIQLEGDPGCCPVQAGRSPAFFCANGLKLQLVFPVQSVAPQPRGAVPLVMGVSREPQRRCWSFSSPGRRRTALFTPLSRLLLRSTGSVAYCALPILPARRIFGHPPSARRRCERLLREERLVMPAGVAVAISICSEMPSSRSRIAARSPLRSRRE